MRLVLIAVFVALAVITPLWFRGWAFHTWMGDDLYLWGYFQGQPSFRELFLSAGGGKYRPVSLALQWLFFQLFSSDFQAWTYANAVLQWMTACVVVVLVWTVARKDFWIAFAAAVMFLTSRFSYYGVLQAMGTMEVLGTLLFVLLLLGAVWYARRRDFGSGVALAVLFLVLSLTHERYLAVLPFLVALAIMTGGRTRRIRVLHVAIFCVPALVAVGLKAFVFSSTVLMGTDGKVIGFHPGAVIAFMSQGAANLVWVNLGPEYLSGIAMSATGPAVRVLVGVIIGLIIFCVASTGVQLARSRDRTERKRQFKVFVLWALLTASLLAVASITVRQEYRWLYAPWTASLTYFMYLFARMPWRRSVRYLLLAALVVTVVGADFYYRSHERNVYFFYGERIADSARTATVGNYGKAMLDKTVYLEKSDENDWLFAHDLLLSPYLGLGYRKLVWLDSFEGIRPAEFDPARSVFLRLDWTRREMVDVTSEILSDDLE